MNKRKWVEVSIGLLAILSVILIAVESLMTLSTGGMLAVYVFDALVCLVFAVEFVHRVRHSPKRAHFFKTHSFEILAMIPAFAFQLLGAIPVIAVSLRLLRLVRVVRVVLVVARMTRFLRVSDRFVRRSSLIYLLVASLFIIFGGAIFATVLESQTPEAQITNFSDALWWSISTVTTVGYGDIVPNSIGGRVMGMGLMMVGIGVMTAFISQVSATIIESRLKRVVEADNLGGAVVAEIKSRIDNIGKMSDSEMALLIRMIQSLRGAEKS
ncbi:potassium channel family protein [Chloroflexota bacterium]